MVRSFLEQPGQQLTAFDKRPSAQIGPVQKEQFEGIVDKRGLFGLPIGLKELEGRSAFIVKRGDLTVDRRLFGRQGFESIDEKRIIVVEIRSVARDQPHLFTSLEGKGPVAVKLQFIEPIADR